MRVLYFYPENPLLKNQGNNARALALLEYFKNRNINIDFVGVHADNFENEDIDELKEKGYIVNGYLLKSLSRKKNQLRYFFMYSLPRKILKKSKDFDRRRFGQEKLFEEIAKKQHYDFIIISYAYWANLIDNLESSKAKFIIDTHDFLTSQFQNNKDFSLGKYFETEIQLLNKFDTVFVISSEEKFVFSQFLKNKVEIITHSLPSKMKLLQDKKYDIFYVASNNDHNVKSAKWFFEKVYPLLPQNFKICVVGRINNYIGDYSNVEKKEFVDDLDAMYAQSRMTICPMLSGTGVKIKVIESLSFGLPVVCNERGVDGLLNKINNGCLVTNDENEFAENIIQLLSNDVLYKKVSDEAITFFNENHSVLSNYKVLDTVFKL